MKAREGRDFDGGLAVLGRDTDAVRAQPHQKEPRGTGVSKPHSSGEAPRAAQRAQFDGGLAVLSTDVVTMPCLKCSRGKPG
jgi:hypothetical protein